MEIEKLNIGYLRVSTDKQVQNGYSIDFQKERIEEKFKSEGINNFEIMIDDGISGKSLNRPRMKDERNIRIDRTKQSSGICSV